MAASPTLVQTKSGQVTLTAGVGAFSIGSGGIAGSVLPTTGNELDIYFSIQNNSDTITSIVDNQGVSNTYTVVASDSVGGNILTAVYRCPSLGAVTSAFTVTVTMSGTPSSTTADVGFAEVNSSIGLDIAAHTHSASSGTSASLTAGSANANPNDLNFALIALGGSPPAASITNPPTGFTGATEGFTNTLLPYLFQWYLPVSVVGTMAASWSWTNSESWVAILYSLKGAAAVAPPIPPFGPMPKQIYIMP